MNENVGLNILSYFLQYKSNTLKEQEKKLGFEKKFVVPSTKKALIIVVSLRYSYRGENCSE